MIVASTLRLFVVGTLVSLTYSSSLPAFQAENQRPVFSSRVEGVRLDVLATDESGMPIAGLTAADFEVRDNGVLQKIEVRASVDATVNVFLAFDTSASVKGKPLSDLQAATHLLLSELRAGDRAALTMFNHAVTPVVRLTPDLGAVERSLPALSPSGETSLLDGIYVALTDTLSEADRSLVLVFSDGRDTTSWLQPAEVIESARRTNAVIVVVASAGARRWKPLTDLAEATGGRTIEIESSAQLADRFQAVLREFRSRYVLTFTPTGPAAPGLHRLKVAVRRDHVKVTARTGYVR